jgi:hypothetical protein
VERPRILRFFRIAVTALCLTACVLLVALWVRSYWWVNQAQYVISSTKAFVVISAGGEIAVAIHELRQPIKSSFYTARLESGEAERWQHQSWRLSILRPPREIQVPIWFVATVLVLAGALPWIPWRFSLRTLLIATALVAVTLGFIIWAAR